MTAVAVRERLPNRRPSVIFNFDHGGQAYRCSASHFRDGRLGEIFLSCSKAGSAMQQHADTSAVLASLLMQHGVPAAEIARSVAGTPIALAIEYAERDPR